MTNYQSGHDAEKQAADYLQSLGFAICQLNWRTPRCEVDIIAKRQKTLWFIEVKSRSNTRQGYGYEYITPVKLRQMQFAAEIWVHEHHWTGLYQLGVVSIDGQNIQLIDDVY